MFVLPFNVSVGCTEESMFSLAFSGYAICQRDFLFEGVIEKCHEPVVRSEYTGELKVLQLRIWWRIMVEETNMYDYFGRWTIQGL